MQDKNEVWQVQVNGQIYEATFAELTEWIAERSLLATDQVRKKGLSWMQADRVPILQSYFSSGKQNIQVAPPAPIVLPKETAKDARPQTPAIDKGFETRVAKLEEEKPLAATSVQTRIEPVAKLSSKTATQLTNSCHFHPKLEAAYICKQCHEKFCKGCPKAYGAVKICPLCGYFCETYKSIENEQTRKGSQQKKVGKKSESGFDIFGTALAYPFKHPISFVSIGLFYAILSLTSYFGLFAALILGMIALAIVFGCCSRVIEQVADGDLESNYVPSGEDFSLWESVVHPASLGIAVYLITWLPISLIGFLFSSSLGDTTQILNREYAQQFGSFFLFVVLSSLAVIWFVFYFPIALTIAGYTQSFRQTINPLVGFDMIRQMGASFWKTFLMYLVLIVAAVCLFFVVQIVTAPLSAAGFGILPSAFLNSFVWFYLYLVISCVFGYAIYQSKDRLKSKF